MPKRTAPHARCRTALAACAAQAGASAVAVAACAYDVPSQTRMPGGMCMLQVTPHGSFGPNDGRAMDSPPWNIDGVAAASVIQRFHADNARQPLVIDYEHQTLNKEKNGQPAPAAGWFRDLRWIDGQGLFAVAELTQRAQDYVKGGEYRYFSPVFEYDRASGRVLALHMGALTNRPAISAMEPLSLVAAASAAFLTTLAPPEPPQVNPLLKALLAALGLPDTTTEEAATAALCALGPLAPLQERASAACTALSLPANANAQAITAACTHLAQARAAAPDPAQFVPVQAVVALQSQLAALTARQLEADVDALVKPALADGRLLPSLEAWARKEGKENIASLSAFLAAAQPMAALVGTQTGGKPPTATASGEQPLSAAELAVCSAMGLTPEAYRKAGTALATGATA